MPLHAARAAPRAVLCMCLHGIGPALAGGACLAGPAVLWVKSESVVHGVQGRKKISSNSKLVCPCDPVHCSGTRAGSRPKNYAANFSHEKVPTWFRNRNCLDRVPRGPTCPWRHYSTMNPDSRVRSVPYSCVLPHTGLPNMVPWFAPFGFPISPFCCTLLPPSGPRAGSSG